MMLRLLNVLLASMVGATALAALLLSEPANAANVAMLTPCSMAEKTDTNIAPQVCQLTANGDHSQTTSDFSATAQSFGTAITIPGLVRLRCAADNASNCAFNCGTGTLAAATASNLTISAGQVEYVNVPPAQANATGGWNCSVFITAH